VSRMPTLIGKETDKFVTVEKEQGKLFSCSQSEWQMAELVPIRLLRPRVFGVNQTSGKDDVPVCRADTKH
jgi:hypothetical protein